MAVPCRARGSLGFPSPGVLLGGCCLRFRPVGRAGSMRASPCCPLHHGCLHPLSRLWQWLWHSELGQAEDSVTSFSLPRAPELPESPRLQCPHFNHSPCPLVTSEQAPERDKRVELSAEQNVRREDACCPAELRVHVKRPCTAAFRRRVTSEPQQNESSAGLLQSLWRSEEK